MKRRVEAELHEFLSSEKIDRRAISVTLFMPIGNSGGGIVQVSGTLGKNRRIKKTVLNQLSAKLDELVSKYGINAAEDGQKPGDLKQD